MDERVLESLRSKACVVTGGTGLIGRQVVDILRRAQARVKVVSLDRLEPGPGAELVFGDLTDLGFCREVFQGADFVFHLAGVKGSMEVSRTKLASHFVPTMMMNCNALEAARLAKVEKLVYTSSIGAYADAEVFREEDYQVGSAPMDFAGWAKRMGELQIQAYKVQFGMENFACVRPSNVYGPGDNFDPDNAMVIPSLMGRIRRGEKPLKVWGDGRAIRDFVFSRDAAEGIVLALLRGTRGAFVNLGGGGGQSVRELVEALRSFIDFDFVFDASKPSGAPRKVMDIARARDWLGWRPRTALRDGLQETWEWFLAHPAEHEAKQNYFRTA